MKVSALLVVVLAFGSASPSLSFDPGSQGRDPATLRPLPNGETFPTGINRIRERLFVGGAILNDGNPPPSAKDWLEALISSTTSNAQTASLATGGNAGLVGGTRTSDSAVAGAQGAQAVSGFVLNDNATARQSGYAGYFESRRYPGAGVTHGVEVNGLNGGSVVPSTPFALVADGITPALWLTSGRADAPAFNNPSSLALGIANNGSPFLRGIVFGHDAIAGVSRGAGVGAAISMTSGHVIDWYTPDGAVGAIIWSSITGGQKGQRLVFTDAGPQFRNVNDMPTLSVSTPPGTVNGVAVTPGAAGTPPTIAATGGDRAIDLALLPKGLGRIVLGAATYNVAQAQSPASSNAPCATGDHAWDGGHIYVCVASNRWRRAPLSDF